jgi:hypothetical protein
MYTRDNPDRPDAEAFWGFRHVIHYVPEFATWDLQAFDTTIEAADPLPLAFVFDTRVAGADAEDADAIERHRGAVKALRDVRVTEIVTRDGFCDLLRNARAQPLLYFYTHAFSAQTGEAAEGGETSGADASYITIAGQQMTLREMKDVARAGRNRFASAPFLFLNACQGAELDATQTTGLLPYFISLGARGAIGTEIDTPALFAAEFAERFLAAFVRGDEELGSLLLRLRRLYLKEQRNIMGLVYALHASGNIRIVRNTPAASG